MEIEILLPQWEDAGHGLCYSLGDSVKATMEKRVWDQFNGMPGFSASVTVPTCLIGPYDVQIKGYKALVWSSLLTMPRILTLHARACGLAAASEILKCQGIAE